MAFVGITFDGQNVSPKDDGALYAAHYGDGILDGCSMTIGGNNDTLVIDSGHIIACGRVCQVNGATELTIDNISQAYVQVYLQYDISQAEGEQWDWGYNQSNTIAGLPSLTMEDINGTGNIYQAQLAILETNRSGSLTSINRTMPNSPITAVDDLMLNDGTNQLEGTVDSGGSGIRGLQGFGSPQGIYFPQAGASDVILYGNGDSVFVRPNGLNNDSGRATFYANGDFRIQGQMLGGTTTLTGNALVSSVTGNTVVARVNSGLDANARYIVFGYFGGTPSNSNAGSTDIAIDVDGSAYRIQSIFSNSSVTKYQTIDAWVIGATSKIELRVWTSSQHTWNNIVAQLQVVRIA